MTASLSASQSQLMRFATVGAAAWAIATTAIRLAPADALLRLGPAEAGLAVVVGLGAVVGLAGLLVRDIARDQRVAVMSAFVLPGMVPASM